MKHLQKYALSIVIALFILISYSCSSNKSEERGSSEDAEIVVTSEVEAEPVPEYGVGPIESVALDAEIDEALAEKGKSIFDTKCLACHNFEQRMIGPALNGITEKRNPAWIMNMIVNPQEMTKKDPIAKQLLEEYNTQMVNMNVNEEDARALLEYFRLMDEQG